MLRDIHRNFALRKFQREFDRATWVSDPRENEEAKSAGAGRGKRPSYRNDFRAAGVKSTK